MNLLMKYSLPFPVTIVRVVVITSSVRGFVHVCGFSSNKPRSRAFCVGWFRAVPTLHKYSLSRNHWKSRISPKSTPFCFRIFASSSIPHDDGELMMAVANATFGACASICFCWLSIVSACRKPQSLCERLRNRRGCWRKFLYRFLHLVECVDECHLECHRLFSGQ